VELLALKEVQLGSNTNISHVQNERLIMQAVPPHQFVVGMLYAFRTPRSVTPAAWSVQFKWKVPKCADIVLLTAWCFLTTHCHSDVC